MSRKLGPHQMSNRAACREPVRVAYVIANEDLSSPLLTRQVVELLAEEVAQGGGSIDIKVLLFQSLPSLIKRRKRLRELKERMILDGVALSVIPNLTPWPFPNFGFKKTDSGIRPNGVWNRFAARAFSVYAFPFLVYQYLIPRCRIFHTRSYPPGFAVNAFKKVLPSVKHVFDPRSDFPEENVVAGRWSLESRDFNFWKKAEAALLLDANITACISKEYVDHFERNGGHFSHFLAPNNVDTHRFTYDENARNRLRRELNWSDADAVFVYLGGMSASGWHRPEFYREFLLRVRKHLPNAKLLMLIPRHANSVTQKCFSGIDGVAIRNPTYEDVPRYLSAADAGLMYMHRRRLAVGTKLGEYLAMGLPMICNRNCLGTCSFLKENVDAGLVIDIGLGDLDHACVEIGTEPLLSSAKRREALVTLANNTFSNQLVARSYIGVYHGLSGGANHNANGKRDGRSRVDD